MSKGVSPVAITTIRSCSLSRQARSARLITCSTCRARRSTAIAITRKRGAALSTPSSVCRSAKMTSYCLRSTSPISRKLRTPAGSMPRRRPAIHRRRGIGMCCSMPARRWISKKSGCLINAIRLMVATWPREAITSSAILPTSYHLVPVGRSICSAGLPVSRICCQTGLASSSASGTSRESAMQCSSR